MTYGEYLEAGRKRLKEAGVPEPELDAWYLFEAAFQISRAEYFLCAGQAVRETHQEKTEAYENGLRRREGREPLQHILGTQEFMGLEFEVNGYVLIPRQDTETLVEAVLSEQRDPATEILDMCTGSGCIAISLSALGGYRAVEGADISRMALETAKRNGTRLLGAGRVKFRESNLFSAFSPEEAFHVIVSNPPYIPSRVIDGLEPEVRDFEPRNALDGMEDGLYFYRLLAEQSGSHLKDGGCVYFEIGHDQGEAVCELLSAHGFCDMRVIKDLAGKDRVVFARKKTVPAAVSGQEDVYV